MPIIRSKPGIFGSCGGPMIACSPEAAELVGLEAAVVLNNLCMYYSHLKEIKDKFEPVEHNGNKYLLLHRCVDINLEDVFSEEKIQALVEKLEKENLIEILEYNDDTYFRLILA